MEKYITSELEELLADFNRDKINTKELKPPTTKEGKGKKRVIHIEKVAQNNYKVFWCFEKYI